MHMSCGNRNKLKYVFFDIYGYDYIYTFRDISGTTQANLLKMSTSIIYTYNCVNIPYTVDSII